MNTTSSLPLRTLGAAALLGCAGVAVARAVAILLAAVAVPSFERTLRPAKFVYDAPAALAGSATWPWMIAVVALILFPLLLNRSWASMRTLSLPGIVKLLGAAVLTGLVAFIALSASDFFVQSPWGGGGPRAITDRVLLSAMAGLCGGGLLALYGQGTPLGAPGVWIDRAGATVNVRWAFVRGFVAAVVVSLLAFVAADGLVLLFQSLGYLGESAEVSPLGWARLELGLSVGLGLLIAACGALLTAASSEPATSRQRVSAAAIASAPAVALIVVSAWFKGYIHTSGESDRTLAQVAGLEPAPAARLIILPGASGARVVEYPMTVTPVGWAPDTVGATERNVTLTAQYLKAGTHWTMHTAGAWHVASAVHDRLLQPELALRERVDASEATGSILSAAVAVAKVQRMPMSGTVRDVAARLLDTARFTGERRRAELQADAAKPRDRLVSGRVDLPAALRAGARVGLFRQSTMDAPTYLPSSAQLVAAADLDVRGAFAFGGLPPGIYAVGVLLPPGMGSDPKRVSVTGAWRVVDVSKESKRGDVGTVAATLSVK